MVGLPEDEIQDLKAAVKILEVAIRDAEALLKWRVYASCPRCGVEAGDPCITDGLNVKEFAHAQRVKSK